MAVGEPGPQPLHVAVTQQAAGVEDAEERRVTGEAQREPTVRESTVNESTGEIYKHGGRGGLRSIITSRDDLQQSLLARA